MGGVIELLLQVQWFYVETFQLYRHLGNSGSELEQSDNFSANITVYLALNNTAHIRLINQCFIRLCTV